MACVVCGDGAREQIGAHYDEIYEVTNGRINITLPPNCAVILKNIGRETETTD